MRTPKERDVSPSALSRPCAEASSFPELLKAWRQKRRLSQLGLALQSGVSQRHVSFLESGRARPSRTMILQLSETLEVPLRDRNDWLVAAGFAPVFRARPLDDPQMSQVMGAVRRSPSIAPGTSASRTARSSCSSRSSAKTSGRRWAARAGT